MALAPAALVWLGLNLASNDVTCTPTTGVVTFTGNIPTVVNQTPQHPHPLPWLGLNLAPNTADTIAATTGVMTFVGNVPTLDLDIGPTPTTGVVTFTGNIPTIGNSNAILATTGVVTFSGNAPTVTYSSLNFSVSHDLPTLWFADVGYMARFLHVPVGIPQQSRDNVATYEYQPTTGEVTFTGNISTVFSGGSFVLPTTGEVEFNGGRPVIGLPLTLTPGSGTITFTGNVPGIDTQSLASPTTGVITFIGNVPTLDLPVDIVFPDDTDLSGIIFFIGNRPTVDTQEQIATPTTGVITFTGNIPLITGVTHPEDIGRPTGGWKRKPKKAWYEELPTPEEVQAEREALGILPKRAQKIVNDTVSNATDNVSKEQAALLTAAYLEESKQRSLVDKLREKAAKSKTKWSDDMFTVTRALILDQLRKKADRDELERILREQEHEEVEANEILEIWMDL